MRYLVNMSYDGTMYYGFQKQKNKRTIADEIEDNLSKIFQEQIKIIGCSRTDRGVHANDFYFHFDSNKELNENKLLKSLNNLSSDEIYFKKIVKVSDEFHARYNVKSKEYVYIINTKTYEPTKRNHILQYNKNINKKLIKKASKYLIGTHDFKSFTQGNEKENTVRTINYIKLKEEKGLIYIYINADGFLKYMIRNIIGLFLDLNEGKKNIKEIKNIIDNKDRTNLGIKALPCGLYLNKVNY